MSHHGPRYAGLNPVATRSRSGQWILRIGLMGLAVSCCAASWFWNGTRSRDLSCESVLEELAKPTPLNAGSLVSRARVQAELLVDALNKCKSMEGKAGRDATLALAELSKRIDAR